MSTEQDVRDAYLATIVAGGDSGALNLKALGNIYVFKGVRYVKIGWSANPEGRMRYLQEHVPFRLELLHAMPGTMISERAVQKVLVRYRSRGDWFHHNAYVGYAIRALKEISESEVASAFRMGRRQRNERNNPKLVQKPYPDAADFIENV